MEPDGSNSKSTTSERVNRRCSKCNKDTFHVVLVSSSKNQVADIKCSHCGESILFPTEQKD